MENRSRSRRNFDPRDHLVATGAVLGGAALIGMTALNLGGGEPSPAEKSSQGEQTSKIEGNPLKDMPSTITNIGQYTPISSETRHYVTIQEDLPGPAEIPGTGDTTEVTIVVPADKADDYKVGQDLTPQQTNDLLESEIE